MAQRILPEASLNAVANPVDTFVAPRKDVNEWTQVAESLSSMNPKLQGLIQTQYKRNAEGDAAAGVVAADSIPSEISLEHNKKGWQGLIESVRKRDQENGTDNATRLVGTSPHFQRGLVTAKAKRIGMGLSGHLQQLWVDDADGVKSMDNPAQVKAWMEKHTQDYAEKTGANAIDPLITAETFSPYVGTTQETLLGNHMNYRAQARVEAYANEFTANVGMIVNGGSTGSSSVQGFIKKLTQAESGGNSSVVNDLGYGGWLQFGQDRLADYNNIHGTNITVAEFAKNEELQKRINVWHINDIDKLIASKGYVQQGWSLDGLRAVAHLGGKGGLQEFVARAGTSNPYDPDDAYTNKKGVKIKGTKLSDYYTRFSKPSKELQAQAQEAIENGLAPKDVNKMLVESVIAQAEATQNPALLDTLDDISTGSGPLGNIGWVKDQRTKAIDRIDDAKWQASERQRTLEDRERADLRKSMVADGYAAIMADPFGDHSELINSANEADFGEMARSFYNLQQQLRTNENQVETDQEAAIFLRNTVRRNDIDQETQANMIMEAVTSKVIPYSVGAALMDDMRSAGGPKDYLRDTGVRNWVDNNVAEIKEALTQKDFVTGEILVSGLAIANQFEEELTDEILAFVQDNPDVSVEKVRLFTRKKARELRKDEYYQKREVSGFRGERQTTELESAPTTTASPTNADPMAAYSDAEIATRALQQGVDVETYKSRMREAAGYTGAN